MHEFVAALQTTRLQNCFNPYADCCSVYDLADAPTVRANMLSDVIERAEERSVDAIWIGRDLGYRGGRRTGLALTDDVHFSRHLSRWEVASKRPTTGPYVAERTASIVWELLDAIPENVFLWNVFPLHPHDDDQPFSNRQHSRKERKVGEEILSYLIDVLQPSRIVAVGNDASEVAKRHSSERSSVSVRHPSYGGQTIFRQQIRELYSIEHGTLI